MRIVSTNPTDDTESCGAALPSPFDEDAIALAAAADFLSTECGAGALSQLPDTERQRYLNMARGTVLTHQRIAFPRLMGRLNRRLSDGAIMDCNIVGHLNAEALGAAERRSDAEA